MISEILISIGLILFLLSYLQRKNRSVGHSDAELPPSPRRVPVLGSFPFLRGRRAYEFLEEFDKESGPHPIVSLQAINRFAVFVNDASLVRKIFTDLGHASSDRPFMPMFSLNNDEQLGIVNSPTNRWVPNRRFALRVLREFGLGKAHIIDSLIEREMSNFRSKIDAAEGKPICAGPLCNRLVGGVMSNLLFGQNLESEGPWFDAILKDCNTFLQEHYLLIFFFPRLYHLYKIPILSNFLPSNEGVLSQRRVLKFMKNNVIDVRKALASTEKQNIEPTNFIEAYFLDPNNPSHSDPSIQLNSESENNHVARILIELFLAGVDTTAMTLEWGMMLLSLHPEIQERAHREIEMKIGCQTPIKNSHAQDLPFVKAVVHEVIRYGCVATHSIPHTVHEDMIVEAGEKKYRIPANCYLHVNIFALLRSEKYWKRPYEFNPVANFMDDEGEEFLLRFPDAFLPFSIGRRVCLGESLARNESFVTIASILQSYRVRLADKYSDCSKEYLMEAMNNGPIRGPRHVEMIFGQWM